MAFRGKVVIVTGAGSGIGAATARKFAAEGADLSLVDKNEENLRKVAAKCEDPLVVVADLSKDEDIKKIVDDTIKRFGRLDVLLNIAGCYEEASFIQEDSIEVYDRIMATNLRAAVLLTHRAAPHLIQTKGNVVNVSSTASMTVSCGVNFAYNVSKAGLDHFTRSIASELGTKGVRVNAVNPGPVLTDLVKDIAKKAGMSVESYFERFFKSLTVLGRLSRPEEIAEVMAFLAGDTALAVTGSTFVIDNGLLVKGKWPTS